VKCLVDTNVILDILLDRRPHSTIATQILALIETSQVEGLLCATTITTIDYLLSQSLTRTESRRHLTKLISLFDIAPVNRAVIDGALCSRVTDFEDAVLDQAAHHAGADAVITRNTKDFLHSAVKALDPKEFLAQLGR
jgi:predicted nucleic acid-binding protein